MCWYILLSRLVVLEGIEWSTNTVYQGLAADGLTKDMVKPITSFFSHLFCVTGHGMVHKSLQASPMWSSIIANLKMSVKVKRRRFHLKSHNDCFLGSDAVSVVLAHIVQNKFFEGADISRDKVVRVCQALLDCKVFETVGAKVFGKDKRQDVFQDSNGYLYRFLNTQMPSMDELEKGVLSPGIQSTFCSASCRWLFVLILFLLFETNQYEILIGCSVYLTLLSNVVGKRSNSIHMVHLWDPTNCWKLSWETWVWVQAKHTLILHYHRPVSHLLW